MAGETRRDCITVKLDERTKIALGDVAVHSAPEVERTHFFHAEIGVARA
ncbi:MAG: hypothetical protein IPL93_14555 [Actinomycetales bacterium]|nr:hypothetical protein [Actinomycetales bacterium]